MFYKNPILILSLIMLAGCSNQYRVTFDSYPQGATVICSGESRGYTPIKLYYDESVRLKPHINVSGCSANWISGAKETYPTQLKVFPDGATIITLERPKGLGYSQDEAFALELKQKEYSVNYYSVYDYDVSGYGNGEYVSGNIDASGDRYVDGYLTLDDGTEVSFDGEWTGNGMVEGYDENGNYYELEVD